jgi:hypothetical protein
MANSSSLNNPGHQLIDHGHGHPLNKLLQAIYSTQQSIVNNGQILSDILTVEQQILAALTQPTDSATQISILFSSTKEPNMPITLPAGGSDTFYIFGTAPFLGALLGPGQTISVVSADPATVTLPTDPTALPVSAADGITAVPAGTPTILSGKVVGAKNPAQPNVAIVCTATVLNSDGSTAETLTDTATVNPAMPASATAIGELFGSAISVTSSTSTKRN